MRFANPLGAPKRISGEGKAARSVRVEGRGLIARCEGSHAAATAAPSTSGLSGPLEISVYATGCARCVTEGSRIARLRAAGLHFMPQSDARAMFLRDRMMQTRCFARCIPRQHGRCDDESGGRKCDDGFFHFQSSIWNNEPMQRLQPHRPVSARNRQSARPEMLPTSQA